MQNTLMVFIGYMTGEKMVKPDQRRVTIEWR